MLSLGTQYIVIVTIKIIDNSYKNTTKQMIWDFGGTWWFPV